MADSRDITGKNRKFTGTGGIKIPIGTEAQRVDEQGQLRFNTEIELMEYYDGNSWKAVDAPPTISSVTTSDSDGDNTILNADGSTLYTITINGGNFSLNPTVTFIGNTGTEYEAGNITRVSGSQITCTTLSSMGTSDDPYDVKVENTSGLAATLDDAFSYNAPPVFDTPSGQLGTVYNGQTISGSTFDASATDAEGNTITYSIVSGSLPGSGLSLSSSTGLITGTLSGTPSLGNYSFVVRAATTEGNAERQFSIQVSGPPFVTATGGTITESGDYKIHTFTGDGCFVVSNAGTPSGSNTVDYLVVAGGGGGGGNDGGGGAGGGYRESHSTPVSGCYTASPLATPTGVTVSATTYPITVGGGGSAGTSVVNGGSGNPSVFSTITSAGGGGGKAESGTPNDGLSGGSGGGASASGGAAGTGGTGNTPPVSPPQGNNGGNGYNPAGAGATPDCRSGGGGGGAGSVGGNADGGGGDGGSGTTSSINGTPTERSSGAGGGSRGPAGPGGNPGGAGAGAGTSTGTAGSGSANSGGGGGGKGENAPLDTGIGSGGSGIVIIRYKFQ